MTNQGSNPGGRDPLPLAAGWVFVGFGLAVLAIGVLAFPAMSDAADLTGRLRGLPALLCVSGLVAAASGAVILVRRSRGR